MINLKQSRKARFAGVSTLAIVASLQIVFPAYAQEEADDAVEEVIISGSRVIRDGTQAPTPLTVVSSEQLQDAAPRSLVDGLATLPVFRGNAGVTTGTTGSGGRNGTGGFLDLRGIGSQRTLILLDGRRLVPTGPNNYIDVNILPQSLVSRVDVVTGGASAAYGSDAVAGVVNFILDKKFEGIKGIVQSGISEYDDVMSYKAGITIGKSFADGRGHFLFDAGKMHSDPVYDQVAARPWAKRRGSILAGYLTTNVLQRSTYGGVILPPSATANATTGVVTVSCPLIGGVTGTVVNVAALTAAQRTAQCLLGNTQFLAGGVPAPFDPGEIVQGTASTAYPNGSRFSGTNQIGGDGVDNATTLAGFNDSRSAYTRTSFDLSDNLNIYADMMYGVAHSKYVQGSSFYSATRDPVVIFEGNPFVPASIAPILNTATPTTACGTLAKLAAGGTARCFTMSRHNNLDFGRILADIYNEMASGTVGLTAMLADNWQLDAYYTHGENRTTIIANNAHHFERAAAAADAVLVNGQIICNILNPANPLSTPALRAQYAGCMPFNPFGVGSPSKESIDYITGKSDGLRDSYANFTEQDVVAVSIQGEAWEGFGAGPINVAGGLEARKQTYVQTSDPQSQLTRTGAGLRGYPAGQVGLVGSWVVGNQQPSRGTYKIWEGFVETLVPLLADAPLVKSLDLNLAARHTNYDRSGGVNTWKVGVTYAPIEDLRFRGTVSRDVREPTLNELFQGNAQGGPTVRDTVGFTGNRLQAPSIQIFNNTVGNPDLTVESADTVAFGVVYTPSWLEGFTASVDYYSIDIADAISTLAPQTTVDNCADGVQADCARIIRSSAGVIARIITPFQNLDALTTNGVDIEFGYRRELLGGQLGARMLIGYLGEMSTQAAGAAPQDTAGAVGNESDPTWQYNLTVNYDYGRASVLVQHRWIDGGLFDPRLTVLPSNTVRDYNITNMSLKYRFGADENYEAFLNIQNLFSHDPPPTPQSPLTTPLQANAYLYDTIGTYYTAGVRFKF